MKNKQFRALMEIGKDLDKVYSMPCKPDWKRPKEGDIFDEDKSVKWNREEVLRRQDAYAKEVLKLNKEKNHARDSLCTELYEAIKNEMSDKITLDDAKRIYDYAYSEKHGYGCHDIISFLYELIEVFEPIMNK